MKSHMRKLVPIVLLLIASLTTTAAQADMASCTAQHAQGQRSLRQGKPLAAKNDFAQCASDSDCAAEVRNECIELLEQARAATPSIVFSATDEEGDDAPSTDVVDGAGKVVAHADGQATDFEPGPHSFTFKFPNGKVETRTVTIRQGEKNRLVDISLPPKEPLESETPTGALPKTEADPVPALFWVASALAVVGGVNFTVFALMGNAKQGQLDSCAPSCGPAEVATYDDMNRDYLIADVSLGIGAASAVVAASTLIVWSLGNDSSAEATTPRLGGVVTPYGARFALSGSF